MATLIVNDEKQFPGEMWGEISSHCGAAELYMLLLTCKTTRKVVLQRQVPFLKVLKDYDFLTAFISGRDWFEEYQQQNEHPTVATLFLFIREKITALEDKYPLDLFNYEEYYYNKLKYAKKLLKLLLYMWKESEENFLLYINDAFSWLNILDVAGTPAYVRPKYHIIQIPELDINKHKYCLDQLEEKLELLFNQTASYQFCKYLHDNITYQFTIPTLYPWQAAQLEVTSTDLYYIWLKTNSLKRGSDPFAWDPYNYQWKSRAKLEGLFLNDLGRISHFFLMNLEWSYIFDKLASNRIHADTKSCQDFMSKYDSTHFVLRFSSESDEHFNRLSQDLEDQGHKREDVIHYCGKIQLLVIESREECRIIIPFKGYFLSVFEGKKRTFFHFENFGAFKKHLDCLIYGKGKEAVVHL
jgi:hypothetical protein